MKTLFLMRHAKSSWKYDLPDIERPLNSRGIQDAKRVGEAFLEKNISLDRIICSPSKRTRETAHLVLEALQIPLSKLDFNKDLYDFEGNQAIQVIKSCKDSCNTQLVFGHNHAFTYLINKLGDKVLDNLPTAGIVGITFAQNSWETIYNGKVILTIFPKSLFKKNAN